MAGIDNNTILYLRGDSFNDLSPNPKNITNSGVTINGNRLNFGSSKRLVVDNDPVFTFGSGDFTVEMEVYLTGYSECDLFTSNNNYRDFYFNINPSGKLRFDTTVITQYSTSTIPLNTWSYVCISRKSGTVYMFINGKLQNTTLNNGNITMSSPRIGYHDAYTSDKIEGELRNIRVSNMARYTEDFIPPTQPFNSLNINVSNQTDTNIEFNVEKLGQETINKVEVLVNGIVSETYTDSYDSIDYLIDKSLIYFGINNITIRVTFDDNYTEEKVLVYKSDIPTLPVISDQSSLITALNSIKEATSLVEAERNILAHILTSKNVEVSEDEKMSELIDKVELFDSVPERLYLYKDGDECSDVTGGWTIQNVMGRTPKTIEKQTNRLYVDSVSDAIGIFKTLNAISLSNYNKLCVDFECTITPSTYAKTSFEVRDGNDFTSNSIIAFYKTTISVSRQVVEIDISNITSSLYIGSYTNHYTQNSTSIYNIWLEK